MKLYIDTSDREKIIIGIDEKRYESLAKEDSSQKLLPFIDEILKKEKKKVSDIDKIEVDTGPGSFTGLRVGVAVANTLGWALKVPVNGRALTEQVEIVYK